MIGNKIHRRFCLGVQHKTVLNRRFFFTYASFSPNHSPTLPSLKLTASLPLKIGKGPQKERLLFQLPSIFRFEKCENVRFRECYDLRNLQCQVRTSRFFHFQSLVSMGGNQVVQQNHDNLTVRCSFKIDMVLEDTCPNCQPGYYNN